MQTLTVQVTHQSAIKTLRDLEVKRFIRIVENPGIASPALAGSPLSVNAFKEWIKEAEEGDTVSLKDAKQKWTGNE